MISQSDGITVNTDPPTVDMVIEDPTDSMVDVDWLAQDQDVDIKWSGSDSYGIDHFKFSIGTTRGGYDILSWSDAGDKTDTTVTGLSLNEGIQYYSNVCAIDMAGNISEITTSDGFQIDASPPSTGSINDGLARDIDYSATPDSVFCNWSSFEDSNSGINYYEVAIGSTPGGTDILNFKDAGSRNSFSQAGFSLDHGTMYYTSVKATDFVGNISDFVSSDGFIVDVYPGPPFFVESTPNIESYLPLTQNSQIVIKFSEPLSYYELGLESFLDFDIHYDESLSSDSLVIAIKPPLCSRDTIQVYLENLTDLSGQVSEKMSYSFYSEILADYTGDLQVDVNDLSIFVNGWTEKDYSLELGPLKGEVPHFTPYPDSTYDLRDVMAFTRMWHWSKNSGSLPILALPTLGEEIEIIQSGQGLNVKLPRKASSGRIVFQYSQISTDISVTNEEFTGERLLLSKKESELGHMLIEFGYLSEKNQKQIDINTEYFTKDNSIVTISYLFLAGEKKIVGQGIKIIELQAIPEKFDLLQNYPNPFNPYTTVSYDLPTDSRVSLVIYDILGREVRTLVDGNKMAGYHSIVWDGRKRNGIPLSTGAYIYRIHTRGVDGSLYSKTQKMLLLK